MNLRIRNVHFCPCVFVSSPNETVISANVRQGRPTRAKVVDQSSDNSYQKRNTLKTDCRVMGKSNWGWTIFNLMGKEKHYRTVSLQTFKVFFEFYGNDRNLRICCYGNQGLLMFLGLFLKRWSSMSTTWTSIGRSCSWPWSSISATWSSPSKL